MLDGLQKKHVRLIYCDADSQWVEQLEQYYEAIRIAGVPLKISHNDLSTVNANDSLEADSLVFILSVDAFKAPGFKATIDRLPGILGKRFLSVARPCPWENVDNFAGAEVFPEPGNSLKRMHPDHVAEVLNELARKSSADVSIHPPSTNDPFTLLARDLTVQISIGDLVAKVRQEVARVANEQDNEWLWISVDRMSMPWILPHLTHGLRRPSSPCVGLSTKEYANAAVAGKRPTYKTVFIKVVSDKLTKQCQMHIRVPARFKLDAVESETAVRDALADVIKQVGESLVLVVQFDDRIDVENQKIQFLTLLLDTVRKFRMMYSNIYPDSPLMKTSIVTIGRINPNQYVYKSSERIRLRKIPMADFERPVPLANRSHLLDLRSYTCDQISAILEFAHLLYEEKISSLGLRIGEHFTSPPSAITRAANLSGAPSVGLKYIDLNPPDLAGKKKVIGLTEETLMADIQKSIDEHGIRALLIRARSHQMISKVAAAFDVPLVNAMSEFAHPTQVLHDLFVLKERFGHFSELNLAYIGPYTSTLHSLMIACPTMGISMTACIPQTHGNLLASEVLQHARDRADASGAEFNLVLVDEKNEDGSSGGEGSGGDGGGGMDPDSRKVVLDAVRGGVKVLYAAAPDYQREGRGDQLPQYGRTFLIDKDLFRIAGRPVVLHRLPLDEHGRDVDATVQQSGKFLANSMLLENSRKYVANAVLAMLLLSRERT